MSVTLLSETSMLSRMKSHINVCLSLLAEIVATSQCLMVNVAAARGLQGVLKSNLGPRGTLKMLVGGAGTQGRWKDGKLARYRSTSS